MNNPWIRKIVKRIVKEKAISGNVFFRIFPLARTQKLTAINTPNIQSFPVISGILMAAAIYINFVKGCTFVRYVPLSTNRLILFIYLFPGSCSEEQLHFLF